MPPVETDRFIFRNVQWITKPHRESTGTPDYAETIRTGLRSADVTCKGCKDEWLATNGSGPGKLNHTIGSVEIACRSCPATESIPIARFH
jgi:hypothetical protein